MMSLPSLQEFIRDSAPQLPAWHWAVLGGLAVAVIVFARVRGRRSHWASGGWSLAKLTHLLGFESRPFSFYGYHFMVTIL